MLVTGASGFAGTHLIERLAAGGATVTAWAHHGGHRPPEGVRATWDAVDVLDRAAVFEAMARARPEVVYHCAGAAQTAAAWDRTGATLEVNARGTHHVLTAIERHAPRARVLVTGSALVYKPTTRVLHESSEVGPAGPYGVSKLAQEMLALHAAAAGLDVVVARPFNHIGPGQSPAFVASSVARQVALIESGKAAPEVLVGNLDPRRDLTDVRDTVAAYERLAAQGTAGTTYNVCSGRAIAVRDLVQGLLARAHVPIAVVTDPARFRPVDVPVVIGSAERLTRETGWVPHIALDQTLDDLLAWWRLAVAVQQL